ncbi:hypothetical protein HJFPF1_06794 [Paramyrothecium foliicola]|nr:hypothetical protein HJFPF1_06794 [Paramyrothecium foliicola]
MSLDGNSLGLSNGTFTLRRYQEEKYGDVKWAILKDNTTISSTVSVNPAGTFYAAIDSMSSDDGYEVTERTVKPAGLWTSMKVLQRGCNFYDSQPSTTIENAYKAMSLEPVSHQTPLPQRIPVGISCLNLQPVFACRAKSLLPLEDELQGYHGPQKDSELLNDIRITQEEAFEVLSQAFPIANCLETIRRMLHIQRNSIAAGRPIFKATHYHAFSSKYIFNGAKADHDEPCNRDEPKSQTNPILRDRLPSCDPYMYNGVQLAQAPPGIKEYGAGFVYQVPYMAIMDYPPQLLETLEEFAEFATKYPHDKLDTTAMVFAAQLWCDLQRNKTRGEEFFTVNLTNVKRSGDVPNVPLAHVLLYFEHWIRFHENFELLMYIHPFRFIDAYYSRNLLDGHQFTINLEDIDESLVKELLEAEQSLGPLIHTSARHKMIPASWY